MNGYTEYTKTVWAQVLASMVLLMLTAGFVAAQEEAAVIVTRAEGEVTVQENGADEWEPVEEDDVIPLEAQISTGFDSEADLAVGENSVVTALALTRMSVNDLIEEEGVERSEIDLDVGRIDGEVERTEDLETEFEVEADAATASVRGTNFGFDGERLWVGDGQVAIENAYGQEVNVFPSEESSTDGTSSPESPREGRRQASRVSPYTERGGGEASAPSRAPTRTVTDGEGDLTIEVEFVDDNGR